MKAPAGWPGKRQRHRLGEAVVQRHRDRVTLVAPRGPGPGRWPSRRRRSWRSPRSGSAARAPASCPVMAHRSQATVVPVGCSRSASRVQPGVRRQLADRRPPARAGRRPRSGRRRGGGRARRRGRRRRPCAAAAARASGRDRAASDGRGAPRPCRTAWVGGVHRSSSVRRAAGGRVDAEDRHHAAEGRAVVGGLLQRVAVGHVVVLAALVVAGDVRRERVLRARGRGSR